MQFLGPIIFEKVTQNYMRLSPHLEWMFWLCVFLFLTLRGHPLTGCLYGSFGDVETEGVVTICWEQACIITTTTPLIDKWAVRKTVDHDLAKLTGTNALLLVFNASCDLKKSCSSHCTSKSTNAGFAAPLSQGNSPLFQSSDHLSPCCSSGLRVEDDQQHCGVRWAR